MEPPRPPLCGVRPPQGEPVNLGRPGVDLRPQGRRCAASVPPRGSPLTWGGLEAARKDGSLWYLQRGLPVPVKNAGPGRTREEVQKEVLNLLIRPKEI